MALGNHPQKDLIIASIEDESRMGVAFDDDTMSVLHKLSCADLLVMQRAFNQVHEFGRKREKED